MAKCLECIHWKPCFNGKEWDAAIASPCKYFATDIIVGSITNADRIRAMSDEELGIFLAEWAEKPWAWKRDGEGECLVWLQEPVKEGENA